MPELGARHARFARWAVALRIARRSAVQSRGRSLLVMVLIAVPVAGIVAGVVVIQSGTATPAEFARISLGESAARLTVSSGPDPSLVQDPTDDSSWSIDYDGHGDPVHTQGTRITTPVPLLPTGTRVLQISQVSAEVNTATGFDSVLAVSGRSWDPSFAGRYDLVSGRAPSNDHEILVTRSALARIGTTVGGEVTLRSPVAATVTVVGIATDATIASAVPEIFGSEAVLGTVRGSTQWYLPTQTLDWPAVQALNTHGVTVLSRQVLLDPPPNPPIAHGSGSAASGVLLVTAMGGGFALIEICLLAGAAFAVGARQ